MKRLLLAMLFTCIVSSVFADVRDMVFIVRPNIQDGIRNELLDLSADWKRNGWREGSEWLEEIIEGGHGSGFLYVEDGGNNFIITNRHVVLNADSADIIIQKGRDETVYEDCPVIFVSEKYDLAILTFQGKERFFETGLNIYEQKINDGDEVISAGYPGVDFTKEALWQFARGFVTNSEAYSEEIFSDDYEYLIQHSANIDFGNSGGPLLIETGEGYEVVGVNTYSLSGRDNTFYSIPAETLIEELGAVSALQSNLVDRKSAEELSVICRSFTEEINDIEKEIDDVIFMISDELVSNDGIEALDRILNHRSESEAERWLREFFRSPMNAMRYAAGEIVLNPVKVRTPIEYIQIVEGDMDSYRSSQRNTVRTVFVSKRRAHLISWVFQKGFWRIASVETKSVRSVSSLIGSTIDTDSQTAEETAEDISNEETARAEEQQRLEEEQRLINEELQKQAEEQKRIAAEERRRRQSERRSVPFDDKNMFLYLSGGITSNGQIAVTGPNQYDRVGGNIGVGMMNFSKIRPIYLNNELSIHRLDTESIPVSDPYNNCWYYHLTTGYNQTFTDHLRFFAGGGLTVTFNYLYLDNPPFSGMYDYLGAGPTVEAGIIWNPPGVLTIGTKVRADTTFFWTSDNVHTKYLNLYAELLMGLSW